MKRQTAAEAALRKQIKILEAKMDQIDAAAKVLAQDWKTTRDIRDQFEAEVTRLEAGRRIASTKASTK